MTSSIKKVAILTDPRTSKDKTRIYPVLRKVKTKLDSLGIEWQDTTGTRLTDLKPDPDASLFLVIGGDETMIHFAGY